MCELQFWEKRLTTLRGVSSINFNRTTGGIVVLDLCRRQVMLSIAYMYVIDIFTVRKYFDVHKPTSLLQ